MFNTKDNEISLWEGIYSSFAEAGGDCDVFDSNLWLHKQKTRMLEMLEKYKSKTFESRDYPLPIIVALLASQQETISILDFGGGMGQQYLEVISRVPQMQNKLSYVVVDTKGSIQNRPAEMDQFKLLEFYEKLEDVKQSSFDIIHIASTLQYIRDWKELCIFLVEKYKPNFLVFLDLLAGDVPTFVSHQIFYEKKIPVNFFNFSEFTGLIESLSYNLIYKALYKPSILGKDHFPNGKLPRSHQISNASNLVYMRTK